MKGFDTIQEYIAHKSEAPPGGHGIPAENICQVCGKDFKNIDGVRGHSKIHLSLARKAENLPGREGQEGATTSEGRTEAEIYASLRLEGPTALYPVLRARLAGLLEDIPDVVTRSKTFILNEWDANPSIRFDFRGIEHLLYTGGVKPDKAVYIVNELIKLWNYYAQPLQREGFPITPVQLAQASGWGAPTPGYGYGPGPGGQGLGQSSSTPWGASGYQSQSREPLTEDRMYRLFDEWGRDRGDKGSRGGREPVATVEITGPDGKTARFVASPETLATLERQGLLPSSSGSGGQVDIKEAIEAATAPLQDTIANLREKVAEKEKDLETVRTTHKEDLAELKEEFEKKEDDLKEEIKELRDDVKEVTKERDDYRDKSLRNELGKDGAVQRASDVESRLRVSEEERRKLGDKVDTSGFNSDGTKLLSQSLDKVAEKQPLKEVRAIVRDFLFPPGTPQPPSSSTIPQSPEGKALVDAGLVVQE